MPTYDYRCTKCGYTFAVEQSILDKRLTRCRKCRGKLEKLLPQSISLIFKGSGFYATDYRKTADKTKPGAEHRNDGEKQQGKDGKGSNETKQSKAGD